MSAHSRRSAGPASIPFVLAVILAACGPTVPPIPTSAPTPTAPPETPTPSEGAFVPTAYPASDDAPCDQAKAPDSDPRRLPRQPQADRGQGRLDRRLRAVPAGRRVPGQDRGARLRHQRHRLAASAHRDDRRRTQAIASEVNGTGRTGSRTGIRGTEISLARNDAYWGTHGPERAAHRALEPRLGGAGDRAPERDRGRHRWHRRGRRGHGQR